MTWLFLVDGAARAAARIAARWTQPAGTRARTRGGEEIDPIVTLELQVRLSELADEMRRIEQDPVLYGRAHHYLAVQGAYDALLRDACRLTGLPVEDVPLRAGLRVGDDERFREELELSARGWSW
ncbi:hypothetical protein [Oerskovia flava]|uniref:hypothetical protein n=1 Tax=Oerskovia flava TaxID=2986422 RepID=UPI00223F8E75|nr:hypothetical protein [Oerskovia sp. JB1-3-2]